MTDRPAEDLDYLSFVDYAIGKTKAELPSTDPVAMRLGLTLHRLAGALVYDWESTVHRPRGLSWGGFRVLFVLWLAGPLESRHAARLAGMSRAAVSALVKTLERDGLVTRTQVPRGSTGGQAGDDGGGPHGGDGRVRGAQRARAGVGGVADAGGAARSSSDCWRSSRRARPRRRPSA